MVCAQVMPAVSGLEQAYPGKVTAHNVDAFAPESRKVIKELGFKSHGLVIRSMNGEVLWKQADHTVNIERVKEELNQILGT